MSGNKIVTREVCGAFKNKSKKSVGNTMTDGESLFLHGNKIAEHRDDGVYITVAGWNTPTTRERLNFFSLVRVVKGQLQLDGKDWDGSWTKVFV